jgi:hypothetical protein
MNRSALTTRFAGGVLAVVILTAATERVARTGAPEVLDPFVKHVEPGNDAFSAERGTARHDLAFSRQGRVQRLWHGYEKHIPVIKIAVKGQKRAAPELVSAGPSPRSALEAERSLRIASCRSCTACIHLLPESLSDSPIPLQLSVARPLCSSSGKKQSAGVPLTARVG